MPPDRIVEVFEAYKKELKNMGRKRSVRRPTVSCLYSCLEQEVYPHVLKWTKPNEGEFSILFRRKGSSDWDSSNLDFFKELDSLSPSKKEKYLNQPDYKLGCKRRCKANLRKLCEDKILKYVGRDVIDKKIPDEKEKYYKPFPVAKKRKSNNNMNQENYNKKVMCSEEFRENYFINFNASYNYELPEMELSNASENDLMNGNFGMELSNLKEFLQIKASLPGYCELPKDSLTQPMPLLSNCFTPQIKNGMNIDEVADIL